tara:strand:+ start:5494 stop:6015 length:522 start_codon:yes stop_codon:yes gene_type:complete
MRIFRFFIYLLSATAFASVLSAPISSFFSLYWIVTHVDSVSFSDIAFTLLSDIFTYGPTLFLIYLIGFLPIFIIGTPLLSYLKIKSVIIFGLLGLCSVTVSIFLVQEVIIGTKVISGSRTLVGLALHYFTGFFAGVYFGSTYKNKLSANFIFSAVIVVMLVILAPKILNNFSQ